MAGGAAMIGAVASGHKVTQATAVSGATTTITTTALNADGAAHVPQKLTDFCDQNMRPSFNKAFTDVQATTISGNTATRINSFDDNAYNYWHSVVQVAFATDRRQGLKCAA